MLTDLMILAGGLGFVGSGVATLDWLLGNSWVSRGKQSLPVQEIVADLPVPKWTREDATRSAEMYRKVPSAFWLAPEFTRFDGPPEPRPVPFMTRSMREPYYGRGNDEILWLAQRSMTYRGRRVLSTERDIARDGYVLRLEPEPGLDRETEYVFLTARDMINAAAGLYRY